MVILEEVQLRSVPPPQLIQQLHTIFCTHNVALSCMTREIFSINHYYPFAFLPMKTGAGQKSKSSHHLFYLYKDEQQRDPHGAGRGFSSGDNHGGGLSQLHQVPHVCLQFSHL
ncbi:hypothetical protein AMECASPLE_008032, partial [Ameca splendens]